ncbi:hypothetical protein HPS36_11740 [Halorubrum salinarum]|uniref:Uncharacterized protein n=1 Tax=Halorubrum salinarum TaxID=2739057 RepID=A0A7D4D420_9EURY|nr:hypothetical protein [Halorubrum salinarum]QKG93502.1 hypothetical protein HPS36_11740 [Halorubrum salinarum]
MTDSDEPSGKDEEVDLDEPRPPTTATNPAQDPIEWEAQGESDAGVDGELNELQSPTTVTETVQETPASIWERRSERVSGEDEGESGAGDGA